MNEIIQCLRDARWKVTIHDVGHDTADFVLAVIIDDPTDLWYLGRFCMENDLDIGACFFVPKTGVAYFPRLRVDAKVYGVIVDEAR